MKILPEKYIAQIKSRVTPYNVDVVGTKITINTNNVYPLGKLARIFSQYILDNVKIKNKKIADLRAGCSTLGLVMAQNGAQEVIGVDISAKSVECSRFNIKKHNLERKVKIIKGETRNILKRHKGYFDFILSGPPWSSMSSKEFYNIKSSEQELYRSFFDVENDLINSIINIGFQLLSNPKNPIFISSCLRIMNRIDKISKANKVSYEIVTEADIHNDGNIHYILKLEKI